MSPRAFIDNGYPEGEEFLKAFLSSPDFHTTTLEKILQGSKRLNKTQLALQIISKLNAEKISKSDILSAYVKQPQRTWLSLKLGKIEYKPTLKKPEILLTEFGEEGWYGPIKTINDQETWYIRITKITDYYREDGELKERYIRWPVIAQISQDFVALVWNGFSFSFSELTNEPLEKPTSFPHWNYIPKFSQELAELCQTQFQQPNLHELILTKMWDKYHNHKDYVWRHLRIRAESAGVALNAHSAGVKEIDIRGLQALSHSVANAVAKNLGFEQDSKKINIAEDAIICTLIKEWGTNLMSQGVSRYTNVNGRGIATGK